MRNIFHSSEARKQHTITISEPLAEKLEQLAERRKVSVKEIAIDLLRNALFDLNEASFRNSGPGEAPPIVRMANAIFAAAIDAGAAEMLITTSAEKVTLVAYSKSGTTLPMAARRVEDGSRFSLESLPPHIGPPLLKRYEHMTRSRLRRPSDRVVGTIPITHNSLRYDVIAEYVDTPDQSADDCLRLQIKPL